MRRPSSALLLAGLLLAVLSSRVAGADTVSTMVTFHGPAACPTEVEARALVEDALGAPLSTPREQVLSLRASVTEDETRGFVLKLVTESNSGIGERVLFNPDCRRLTEAAALVIALAIDPERATERARRKEPQVPASVSGTPADTEGRVGSAAVRHLPQGRAARFALSPRGFAVKRESVHFFSRFLVGLGILPLPHVGVDMGIGWNVSSNLQLRAGGAYLSGREADVGASSSRIRISLFDAFAEGCLPRPPFYACLGARGGQLAGKGIGLLNAHTEKAFFGAGIAELGMRQPLLGGFGLVESVFGGLALGRPRFGVGDADGPREVFRPAVGFFQVAVGVSWGPETLEQMDPPSPGD